MVHLTSANVGDTRVVWGNKGGAATRLSRDHRVTDPFEIARIQKAGGFVLKGRVMGVLAVTRSIGDHYLKEFVVAHPHVNQLSVKLPADENDFVIVACDGLFDVMTDQEAVDLVRKFQGDKSDAANQLVREALSRGTTDNVTAVVAWIGVDHHTSCK